MRVLFGVLCLLLAVSSPAQPQSLDPEVLEELRRRAEGARTGGNRSEQLEEARRQRAQEQQRDGLEDPMLLEGERPQAEPEEASPLEQAYRDRLDEEDSALSQFGYDLLQRPKRLPGTLTGRLPDDYRLGVGDELVITLYGNENRTETIQVDREGRLVIEGLGPVIAVNRGFGDLREEIERLVSERLIGTEVLVSVGAPRLVTVYVLGEVAQPGQYEVTAFSDILDALSLAGGVLKSGSLRDIRVDLGDETQTFDLYRLLQGDAGQSIAVKEGARIIVPSIGPTIAVTGSVVRPAIYELQRRAGTTVARALSLAGGPLLARGNRTLIRRLSPEGGETITYAEGGSEPLAPSDLISVQPRSRVASGQFFLRGAVSSPGVRSLDEYNTLSAALENGRTLAPEAYLPFGLLRRVDQATLASTLEPVNLAAVLTGRSDVRLRSFDELFVMNADAVAFLGSSAVRRTVNAPSRQQPCAALQALAQRVRDLGPDRFSVIFRSTFFRTETAEEDGPEAEEADLVGTVEDAGAAEQGIICPELFNNEPDLLPFSLEYATVVAGAVREPGLYPFRDPVPLESLLAVAGGLARQADPDLIELSLFQEDQEGRLTLERQVANLMRTEDLGIPIPPGSSVSVAAKPSQQEPGTVLLTGEFVRPGVYTLRRGERITDLIARAGGLTDFAYPTGAVFTRDSARRERVRSLQRSATELDKALALATLRGDATAEAVAAAEALTDRILSTPVIGRIVVEADPATLDERPSQNIVMQAGDQIFMPRRPNVIHVTGDVLSPGSLIFDENKSVRDYIEEAGGLQSSAEKKKIFVILPNGEARPVRMSIWSFRDVELKPGSTIVVPLDVTPLNFLQLTQSISQILSSIAISAASVAAVSNN